MVMDHRYEFYLFLCSNFCFNVEVFAGRSAVRDWINCVLSGLPDIYIRINGVYV